MYELYEVRKDSLVLYPPKEDVGNIEERRVSVKIGGWKRSLYWNLITLGKCRAFIIRDHSGNVIHYSFLIKYCWKFPFMKKGDFEIGPCATVEEWRGKGIYPYVLSHICKKELTKENVGYMIIEEKNISSIKGVEKVGFEKKAALRKDWIKRYVRGK